VAGILCFMAYGEAEANQAQSTGQNAINAFDPNAISSGTRAGFNSLYGEQNATQNDFINQYKQAISSNPSVQNLYTTGNELYNVPGLASRANTLNNLVLTTPQTTLDTAKGFNYDQNQVNNQTALTLGRLSPLATAATNQLQTAQGLAGQYVQAGITQNQFNLLPVQAQQQYLSELYARQQSGYTTAAEQEYNGLVAKMQSGVQLSQAEYTRANQLAQSEYDYKSAVQTAQLANQYKNVAAGNTLVNTFTGGTYKAK
jgi:hypothetical protein